jgi:hypothetical protein
VTHAATTAEIVATLEQLADRLLPATGANAGEADEPPATRARKEC